MLDAWLYNSTRANLPIVILFHAAFNSFTKFFLSEWQGSPYAVSWWTLAGSVVFLALAVIGYAGSLNLVRGGVKSVH